MGGRRIRVLRVITRLNAGGPSRHVAILQSRLDPERFETLLVHGRRPDGEAPIDPAVSGELRALDHLVRPIAPGSDLKAARGLRRIARDFCPDIVHSHQAKAGLIARAALGGVRRVHTFHGHTFSGYWSGATHRALRLVERSLVRRSDVLIAQSPSQANEINAALGPAAGRRIRQVAPGIDFALVRERARGPSPLAAREPGERRVAFAARLAPVKDVGAFLEAVTPWVREDPRRHRVVIAGGGDEGAVNAARDEAESRGFGASLRFLGHLEHPASLFRDVDVVVCSSRNEGTPLALIEALSVGARVASFAHGGVRDTIGADPRVFLAPIGDRAALTQAIFDAVAGPREVGDGLDLERLFGADRLVDELTRLYEELV